MRAFLLVLLWIGAGPTSAASLPTNDRGFAQFLILWTDAPRDPARTLKDAVAEIDPPFEIRTSPHGDQPPRIALIDGSDDVRQAFKVPPVESLRYLAPGVPETEAKALQSPKTMLFAGFGYDADRANADVIAIHGAIAKLVKATSGYVFDLESRRLYSASDFVELRVETDAVPTAIRHLAINSYRQEDGTARSVTLGMGKFGLPEMAISSHQPSLQQPLTQLMFAYAQALIESRDSAGVDAYDLDIRKLRDAETVEAMTSSGAANATYRAILSWTVGEPHEGDNENAVIELGFDRYGGTDAFTKQARAASAALGWSETVVTLRHDKAIEAASQRAKARLPGLRERVRKGLEPNEVVQVKAPFDTDDGNREWMWVEVLRWDGDTIEGLLASKPFFIPDLHEGQRVTVRQQDVFDYLHTQPDGTVDGNETSALIEARGEVSNAGAKD